VVPSSRVFSLLSLFPFWLKVIEDFGLCLPYPFPMYRFSRSFGSPVVFPLEPKCNFFLCPTPPPQGRAFPQNIPPPPPSLLHFPPSEHLPQFAPAHPVSRDLYPPRVSATQGGRPRHSYKPMHNLFFYPRDFSSSGFFFLPDCLVAPPILLSSPEEVFSALQLCICGPIVYPSRPGYRVPVSIRCRSEIFPNRPLLGLGKHSGFGHHHPPPFFLHLLGLAGPLHGNPPPFFPIRNTPMPPFRPPRPHQTHLSFFFFFFLFASSFFVSFFDFFALSIFPPPQGEGDAVTTRPYCSKFLLRGLICSPFCRSGRALPILFFWICFLHGENQHRTPNSLPERSLPLVPCS